MGGGNFLDDFEHLEAPVGRFETESDAMVYLAKALLFAGIDITTTSDLRVVPPALMAYETLIEPLTQEELHFVIQSFVERYERRKKDRQKADAAWLN